MDTKVPDETSDTIILILQFITMKLTKNKFIIRTVSNRCEAWNTFGHVCNKKGSEVGFVLCMTYKASYKYNHGVTGTSTMSNHIC